MHPALEAVRNAIEPTKFHERVWLVGGSVRDALLGIPQTEDFDLVTTEDVVDLAQTLSAAGASDVVTYARFGTAMVRWHGAKLELVQARKESYRDDSRKPEVQPATLLEDAQRRDFTVNALLRNLVTGEVWDILGCSLADLEAGILRTPLDAAATFRDDPLRMLRAVRFKNRLAFAYAPGLPESIAAEADRLAIVSAERIRDEWVKILSHRSAPKAMADLMQLGLLDRFAPEFRALVGVDQGSYHHLDVWEHTLLVLANVGSGDLVLSLAALLHDVGKPRTRFVDAEGAIRFFGHEAIGAEMSRTLLRRLRFPEIECEKVALLVKSHMRLGSSPEFSATAARRLLRDLGDEVPRLLNLVQADASALAPGVRRLDLGPIKARIEQVASETPPEVLDSPLDGDEIRTLIGIMPGPEIGRWKRLLQEEVLEGRIRPTDKDAAVRWLISKTSAPDSA